MANVQFHKAWAYLGAVVRYYSLPHRKWAIQIIQIEIRHLSSTTRIVEVKIHLTVKAQLYKAFKTESIKIILIVTRASGCGPDDEPCAHAHIEASRI